MVSTELTELTMWSGGQVGTDHRARALLRVDDERDVKRFCLKLLTGNNELDHHPPGRPYAFDPMVDTGDSPDIINCQIRLHSGRPAGEKPDEWTFADSSLQSSAIRSPSKPLRSRRKVYGTDRSPQEWKSWRSWHWTTRTGLSFFLMPEEFQSCRTELAVPLLSARPSTWTPVSKVSGLRTSSSRGNRYRIAVRRTR